MQFLGNSGLDKLIELIKGFVARSIAASNYTAIELPTEMLTAIQDSFNKVGQTATGKNDLKTMLDICAVKGKMETIIRLGGVLRTVTFNYDSFIYFNEYDSTTPDYYNYTMQAVLNGLIYMCRLQLYTDGTWKITTSNVAGVAQTSI